MASAHTPSIARWHALMRPPYVLPCPTALVPLCNDILCCSVQFFTSTAMALPAEIGPDGRPLRPKRQEQGWTQWLQPSRYEQMWQKRVAAQKAAKEQQQ